MSSELPDSLAIEATKSLQIHYFAWVREKMGVADEVVAIDTAVDTVAKLIDWLAMRDPRGAVAFDRPERIRAAVDGKMLNHDADASGATEVALFPPVTGG